MATPTIKQIRRFVDRYHVTDGRKFRLKDIRPGDTHGLKSEFKDEAKELLARGVDWLEEEQERLYAQDRWGVLLIFQAMDAAGKDGTIEHVISGVDPQGTQVYSFKAPSSEDLDHDFLWRCMKALPERGRIGIFNRSYYEEVLIVRVHPEIMLSQKLPDDLVDENTIWQGRYRSIVDLEGHLYRSGTRIIKFFLHLSKEEQRKASSNALMSRIRIGNSVSPTLRRESSGTNTWMPMRHA